MYMGKGVLESYQVALDGSYVYRMPLNGYTLLDGLGADGRFLAGWE